MEFWPGVHSLDVSRHANVYLVIGPPVVLVDTGPPGALPRLLRELRRSGQEPESVSRIVLTHCDVDHTANARALQRLTCATVCAHVDDIPFITGEAPWPGPLLRRVIKATWGRGVPALRVDCALRDGDNLGGLTVLHLPGHTPGHIGLQRGTVLFAGDAVMGGRRLRPAPRALTWNPALARRSIARMSTLDVDLLLPGHGTPINDGARHCAEIISGGR